jgi:hypothetical protein
MNDLEGGTLVLDLHFQKTDRLFLLSFFYFDGICLPRKTILPQGFGRKLFAA